MEHCPPALLKVQYSQVGWPLQASMHWFWVLTCWKLTTTSRHCPGSPQSTVPQSRSPGRDINHYKNPWLFLPFFSRSPLMVSHRHQTNWTGSQRLHPMVPSFSTQDTITPQKVSSSPGLIMPKMLNFSDGMKASISILTLAIAFDYMRYGKWKLLHSLITWDAVITVVIGLWAVAPCKAIICVIIVGEVVAGSNGFTVVEAILG